MWKGFILTVVELRVPSNLTLLPGHLYMMAEALAKEEARRALDMPSCFLKVSRLEAQLLLERHPECGNLLLRPSGDGAGGVSVSTLQTLNGTPVVRHYKVKREGPKYVIDVEEPFSCTSLDAVVNYFVSHSNKKLMPFLLDDDYEKVIGYVEADKENGESVWVAPSAPLAPPAPGPGPAPPRGGPKQLPPSSVAPVSSQDKLPPLPSQDENYVIPIGDAPDADYVNEDVSSPSQPVVQKPRKLAMFQAKPPKPSIVPKSEPPKALNSGLARRLAVSSAQALLLRPSGDGAGGVSVSTLQTLNGTPVVRHYKVKREGPKYVIDVEEPFSCTSLDAVVNYFVSHSNKKLMPFLLDDDYEKVIGYVEADKENGESVWVAPSAPLAPPAPGPGPAPPRGGPKQLPPSSVAPVSSQDKLPPLLSQDENYVIPIGDAPDADYVNEDVSSPSQPVVQKPRKLAMFQAKPPKPSIVPKSEPPKALNSGLARRLAVSSAQAFSSPTTGLADVTAELKGKLQRRRALQHAAERAGDQQAGLQVWRMSQAGPSSQN
ncbi:signal-transducing adaptor protein 2 [Physeter macrocephalus]|uniref:Signal-transducing adaptor protein 2 n=1 Tax=Physeter macrocephalus TaxID=9755 RepID=A0A9W2X7F7_PHYMC|nr:signal-transducing adaptor protein 2 [Physeter catodon]